MFGLHAFKTLISETKEEQNNVDKELMSNMFFFHKTLCFPC